MTPDRKMDQVMKDRFLDVSSFGSVNLAVLTQARRIFLRCLLAWRDGYSAMVARSYAEEKIDYAFRTTSVFDLRAVLDDERRAEFDKELLAWSDDHGIPS